MPLPHARAQACPAGPRVGPEDSRTPLHPPAPLTSPGRAAAIREAGDATHAEPSNAAHRRPDGGHRAPLGVQGRRLLAAWEGRQGGRGRGAVPPPGGRRTEPQPTRPAPTAAALRLEARVLAAPPVRRRLLPAGRNGSTPPPSPPHPTGPADFDSAPQSAGRGSNQRPVRRAHSPGLPKGARSDGPLGKALWVREGGPALSQQVTTWSRG
nr:CASP-like protein 4A1 isoform X1 [Equus caballus]